MEILEFIIKSLISSLISYFLCTILFPRIQKNLSRFQDFWYRLKYQLRSLKEDFMGEVITIGQAAHQRPGVLRLDVQTNESFGVCNSVALVSPDGNIGVVIEGQYLPSLGEIKSAVREYLATRKKETL